MPRAAAKRKDPEPNLPPAAERGPALGLVCQTSDESVRYRTITRTRLLQRPARERAAVLEELYRGNLATLESAAAYCARRGIRLYRIPSSLLPFSDTQAGRRVLGALAGEAARAGERLTRAGIRVVCHPDQFVVLNSEAPAVVRNAGEFLRAQAEVLDALGQPRSAWAVIEIHGGKSGRGAELARAFDALPEGVRSRLALENDEYAYGADEILSVCRSVGAPMVFDAHHHVVHEGLETYEHESVARMVELARGTWPEPGWQLVHLSNGRTRFGDRSHSDFIADFPSAYRQVPWIEIEAKMKEQAIFRLQAG